MNTRQPDKDISLTGRSEAEVLTAAAEAVAVVAEGIAPADTVLQDAVQQDASTSPAAAQLQEGAAPQAVLPETEEPHAAAAGAGGEGDPPAEGGADSEQGRVNWRVTGPAAALAVVLILPAILMPKSMSQIVSTISATVVNGLGWYYTLIVVGFVGFALFLALSRYGDIVLGKDDDEPEYSRKSWFAMLFAAGMGIGLVFWGVAEPLSHYTSPPPGSNTATEAARAQGAMNTTFLHWGLSAWAIYVVVGVAVAYMCHRRGRSVSIRWVLEPLLGSRVRGWIGDVIDITAVIGTLFGVATSLGFGATQFASGLDFLGLVKQNAWVLLIIVVVISAMAALSVASGLDKGVKILSNSNLVLAAVLLLAVLLLGEPLFVMREFVQSVGQYIQNFIPLSFRTMPYQGADGESWLGGWTTYYWGWWMSWSPFVGIFIARISRGRTVREFVVGVLAVPTLLTCVWFAVMGGTALWKQIYGGVDFTDGDNWTTTALFRLTEQLPGGPVITGLFLILLVVFFVTSSDSASFVLGMLTSNGSPNPPLGLRLGWAAAQGAIAAVLLWIGAMHGSATDGLSALQVLAVLTALPFSVVMVLSCISMHRAFGHEHERRVRAERKVLREHLETLVENKVLETPVARRRFLPAQFVYTAPRRADGKGRQKDKRKK